MSEMIKRVARAFEPSIWEAVPAFLDNPDSPIQQRYVAERRQRSLENARRAIEAMREPTEVMLKSALGEAYESDRFEAATVYSAIIAAALEPKEPG